MVWLAIVALLSNMLALTTFAPSMATALDDDPFAHLVICTADGAKSVSGDGGSDRQAPAHHCPACTLHAQLAQTAAIVMVAVAIDFPARARIRPSRAEIRPLAVQIDLGGIRSRAPPLFA